MDPALIMQVLPYVAMGIKYGPAVIELIQQATSNKDLVEKIATLPKQVAELVEQVGGALFPDAKKELAAAAGAMAVFNQAYVTWVQRACNTLLPTQPKLAEDGLYGPLTRARVKELQAHLNIEIVDGWVGKQSRAVIDSALAKLGGPVLKQATP